LRSRISKRASPRWRRRWPESGQAADENGRTMSPPLTRIERLASFTKRHSARGRGCASISWRWRCSSARAHPGWRNVAKPENNAVPGASGARSSWALRRDIGTFPSSRPARRTVSEYPVIRAMHAEATQISLKNPREVPRRLQSVTKWNICASLHVIGNGNCGQPRRLCQVSV
jgi:hypothetical protein